MMRIQTGFRSQNGFTLIEVIFAVALSLMVVTAGYSLVGKKQVAVVKRNNSANFAMSLQSFSETLLVNNGVNSDLEAGDHGPLKINDDGRVDSSGNISLNWTVTPDQPEKNLITIDVSAKRPVAGVDQKMQWIVIRRAPLQAVTPTTLTYVTLPNTAFAAPTTVTYSWKTSGWGACDSNNRKLRTVTCFKNPGLVNVDDSLCDASSKPGVSSSCSHWGWQSSAWGACSPANLTQSRVVTCIFKDDGSTAQPSQCTAAMPATTQACTMPGELS